MPPQRPTYTRRPSSPKTERSLLKTITNSPAELVPGCIVACDLALGLMDHTGIYIGRNRIIELNGDGRVRKVSIEEFMSASGVRTGAYLYVACKNGAPIANRETSARARQSLESRKEYCVIGNNCHKFSAYCLTGKHLPVTLFSDLANIIDKQARGLHWVHVK